MQQTAENNPRKTLGSLQELETRAGTRGNRVDGDREKQEARANSDNM